MKFRVHEMVNILCSFTSRYFFMWLISVSENFSLGPGITNTLAWWWNCLAFTYWAWSVHIHIFLHVSFSMFITCERVSGVTPESPWLLKTLKKRAYLGVTYLTHDPWNNCSYLYAILWRSKSPSNWPSVSCASFASLLSTCKPVKTH